MNNYKPRLPRKFKKRLIRLNGQGKVRTCLMLGKLLFETTGKRQTAIYKLANVYDGWAVRKGLAIPFEMKK
jgi:hypothetical protein